jgi:hypothetical protein
MDKIDTGTGVALLAVTLLALILILWAGNGDDHDDPNDGWR